MRPSSVSLLMIIAAPVAGACVVPRPSFQALFRRCRWGTIQSMKSFIRCVIASRARALGKNRGTETVGEKKPESHARIRNFRILQASE